MRADTILLLSVGLASFSPALSAPTNTRSSSKFEERSLHDIPSRTGNLLARDNVFSDLLPNVVRKVLEVIIPKDDLAQELLVAGLVSAGAGLGTFLDGRMKKDKIKQNEAIRLQEDIKQKQPGLDTAGTGRGPIIRDQSTTYDNLKNAGTPKFSPTSDGRNRFTGTPERSASIHKKPYSGSVPKLPPTGNSRKGSAMSYGEEDEDDDEDEKMFYGTGRYGKRSVPVESMPRLLKVAKKLKPATFYDKVNVANAVQEDVTGIPAEGSLTDETEEKTEEVLYLLAQMLTKEQREKIIKGLYGQVGPEMSEKEAQKMVNVIKAAPTVAA
ncbi:hypothetical protein FRB94_005301 [Tulasnella sp. JGI-2019a]|nr:hypothetical protein FRB94_005301 [Tulasnella sp. JGI-2019a]KAG9016162.1 hypothetical protein FRB93_011636 [Tulasnella sp. JGI-2019a]KAG9028842.1 hypothetical protein FRB95_006004 [Tulasnella sp. JGI-2019a]